jgi:phage recombination protein Bet
MKNEEKKSEVTSLKDSQINYLKSLVPASAPNKKAYLELFQNKIMGTDAAGRPRPFEDLLWFMGVCNKLNLDPFKREIYIVYRFDRKQGKEVPTVQTGIDGFRKITTGHQYFGGIDDAFFEEEKGLNHPIKATVTIYRLNPINGERMPITATARWGEYAQKYTDRKTGDVKYMGMWASMPYNQLAKCAEALAHRKGFSELLSGVYTDDEMQQADQPKESPLKDLPKPEKEVKKIKPKDAKKIIKNLIKKS